MFLSRVLYATDFSETSLSALASVYQLKEAGCREVIVLHVIDAREADEVLAGPGGPTEASGEYERRLAARRQGTARAKLDEVKVELQEAGFQVREHLHTGIAGEEIIRVAQAEDVGLIVVGSHGRGNLASAVLGSVSDFVIRNSTRPVLVVRRGIPGGKK